MFIYTTQRVNAVSVTADKPAPYATSSSIIDLIERYRNRGLPSPVTTDVLLRAGTSDSLVSRTLYALQALDLIDEQGMPTKTLEGIRLAPESEYKQRLAQWLQSAYADVLKFVDPAVDDETKVRDAFRSYNPVAQQPRMITLFLGLLAAAGMVAERRGGQSRRGRIQPTQPPRTSNTASKSSIQSNSGLPKKEDVINPPPPPRHTEISEKALEYRLVDLMTEAASKPNVMDAIIEVITFLKTKDVTEPAKPQNEAGGKEDR